MKQKTPSPSLMYKPFSFKTLQKGSSSQVVINNLFKGFKLIVSDNFQRVARYLLSWTSSIRGCRSEFDCDFFFHNLLFMVKDFIKKYKLCVLPFYLLNVRGLETVPEVVGNSYFIIIYSILFISIVIQTQNLSDSKKTKQ